MQTEGSVLGSGLSPQSPTAGRGHITPHMCLWGMPPLIAGISVHPATIWLFRAAAAGTGSKPRWGLARQGPEEMWSLILCRAFCSVGNTGAALPRAVSLCASHSGGPDANLEVDSCHFTTECVEKGHSLIRECSGNSGAISKSQGLLLSV